MQTTDFAPPRWSALCSAPLHPSTPRGVVVEQKQRSTCSTLLRSTSPGGAESRLAPVPTFPREQNMPPIPAWGGN
jgi:hypothetical protein